MLDNSLTDQLASRVKGWATSIGISQKELATLLDIDPGNLSGFLNGRNGLCAERVLKLMRLMNLNRRDLALRFGKPERTTSRIMSLQEQGTPVTQFSNSGYVLWDGGTTDPNDSTDITNTPKVNGEATGDSLLDCLRQVDLIINKPEKSSPIISVRIRQRVKLTAKGRLNQCGMYQTTLTVPGQDLFQPGIAHEPRISATAVSRITVRQESSRVRAYVPKIDSQRTRASG